MERFDLCMRFRSIHGLVSSVHLTGVKEKKRVGIFYFVFCGKKVGIKWFRFNVWFKIRGVADLVGLAFFIRLVRLPLIHWRCYVLQKKATARQAGSKCSGGLRVG